MKFNLMLLNKVPRAYDYISYAHEKFSREERTEKSVILTNF